MKTIFIFILTGFDSRTIISRLLNEKRDAPRQRSIPRVARWKQFEIPSDAGVYCTATRSSSPFTSAHFAIEQNNSVQPQTMEVCSERANEGADRRAKEESSEVLFDISCRIILASRPVRVHSIDLGSVWFPFVRTGCGL